MLSTPRGLLSAFLAAALLTMSVFAQDNGTVLEITTTKRGADDVGFRDVLSSFVNIELQRAGIATVSAPAPETRDAEDLFLLASETDSTYILLSTYELSLENVQIDFTWFDAEARSEVVVVRRNGRVDLQFDSVVAGAIDEILREAKAAGAMPTITELTIVGLDENRTPISEIATSGLVPERRFVTAISAAPFLVNGRASDYFKIGFGPSAFAGYTIGLREGHLSAGVHTGYGRFVTEGELEGVKIQAMPIGLELRYETRTILPFNVFARVAGGAAVLQLDVGDGWRSKVIPFGSAGVGASRLFGDFLEIGFETSYTAMVEEIHPILGFTPAVSVIARM